MMAHIRGYDIQLLSHDLHDGIVLVDEYGILVKAQKSTLLKELDSRKTSDADNRVFTPDGERCYAKDVMNCLWKEVNKDKQISGAVAKAYCAYTASVGRHCGRIDHVFDSYHELSPKNCKRLRRKPCTITELLNVDFDVRLPVQMETFWSSSKNKLLLQKCTIDYFPTMLIDNPTTTKHVFSAFLDRRRPFFS